MHRLILPKPDVTQAARLLTAATCAGAQAHPAPPSTPRVARAGARRSAPRACSFVVQALVLLVLIEHLAFGGVALHLLHSLAITLAPLFRRIGPHRYGDLPEQRLLEEAEGKAQQLFVVIEQRMLLSRVAL